MIYIIAILIIIMAIVGYDDWREEVAKQKKHNEIAEQYFKLYESWRQK